MPSSLRVPVRNTFGLNAVAFRACDVACLHYVVSSVFRTVHEHYFILVINKILNSVAQIRRILLSNGQYSLLAYKTEQLVVGYRKYGRNCCLYLQPSLRLHPEKVGRKFSRNVRTCPPIYKA